MFKGKTDNTKTQSEDKISTLLDTIENHEESAQANAIFLHKKLNQINQWFANHQKKYFMIAYVIVSVFVLFIYLLLPLSKVKSVRVVGNHYLTDLYANKLVKDTTSRFALLNFDAIVNYRLQKNPWIKSVSTSIDDKQILTATIQENQPIGYYINDDLETIIVFSDGKTILSNAYTTDTLAKIPVIIHFDESNFDLLVSAFNQVDPLMIESIAEIDKLSLSYDDELIMLTMSDGNYFIGSRFGMGMLNSYNKIASKLSGNGFCLYATDNQNVIYQAACPWIEPEEKPVDYFLDCDGNPMLDASGNPIAIQYLTDANGNYIYDSKGNKTITNQIEMPNCEVEANDDPNINANAEENSQ